MRLTMLLLALGLAFISCSYRMVEGVKTIDIETLKTDVIGKDVQFIDVRTPEEYTKGHIDDAINIDIADVENFKKEMNTLDKTKPIYLYCHSSRRSNRASRILKELDFETIYDFSGGWSVWAKN